MARTGLMQYLAEQELDPASTPLLDYIEVDQMDQVPSAPTMPMSSTGPLAKMYEELSRQATSDEEAGISQLSKYINDYQAQPRPTDYRALAAWAETMRPTGGAIPKAIEQAAPESMSARSQKIIELQNQLQQRRGGLAQRKLSGLQTMLNQQAAADRLRQQQELRQQQFQQTQALADKRFEQQANLADKRYEAEAKRSEEYLRHNQAMEKIMADRIAAQMAQAQATQDRADSRQKEGLDEKREKKVEDQLIKFESKAIDAVPLVENLNAIEDIIGGKLEQYDPKTGTINGKKIDLPGKSIPGIGRVFAPGSIGESLQSAFSNIFNTTLKERSGAAVTDQELARLKNEFAQGKFNTEEKMLEALQRYKTILRKRMRQHEAAFSPDVRERFKKQGGMLADDFLPESGAGKPPPPPPAPLPGGEKFKAGEAPWEVGQ